MSRSDTAWRSDHEGAQPQIMKVRGESCESGIGAPAAAVRSLDFSAEGWVGCL